jgi:hypothetical protein
MRGFLATGNSTMLRPNLPNLDGLTSSPRLASNGFVFSTTAGQQHIYIAIRRGPMREPESGTQVFNTIVQSPQSSGAVRTVGFPADMILGAFRNAAVGKLVNTRLTGFANTSGASQNTKGLFTNATAGETDEYPLFYDVWNTTAKDGDFIYSSNGVNYFFRRAPGFFDVVAYTGTGANRTVSHNLGAAPELMIVKKRSAADNWVVYAGDATDYLILNSTAATADLDTMWNDTAPTGSVFSLGTNDDVNGNTARFIAYLFATLPGISKVGSYTGNGSNQTINCGFTTGARFILIKRTDSTGDWYVWDTARGIVTGNDPHLSLNTTAAEVTTNDTIDPDSTGFIVNQVAATNVNVNTATYIYLAIA